jgi:hypothetical protein
MPIDPEQNKKLHQVWDIDEKLQKGEVITEEEKQFYNDNFSMIVNYYQEKSDYWNSRKPL